MTMYVCGNFKVISPPEVKYRGPVWSKVEFQAVSNDWEGEKRSPQSFYYEMYFPKDLERQVMNSLVPGVYCSIFNAKLKSPEKYNWTKISISFQDLEILNVNTEDEEDKAK